jgi:hypothetical protein
MLVAVHLGPVKVAYNVNCNWCLESFTSLSQQAKHLRTGSSAY